MTAATVTSKGQITVPADVRLALNVVAGIESSLPRANRAGSGR